MDQSIEQIREQLLGDSKFIQSLRGCLLGDRINKAADLEGLIEEIREILEQLIQHQLEFQLREMIQDNNRILSEIKEAMLRQPSMSNSHEIVEDISFSEVHRLMEQERKKMTFDDVNDASLQKSISAFVELKVQTIEEKMMLLDKRLKSMEDKYETNLKSIWNVLSITQGAVFDHLKQCKGKQNKQKSAKDIKQTQQQPQGDKKSLFGFFKFGRS